MLTRMGKRRAWTTYRPHVLLATSLRCVSFHAGVQLHHPVFSTRPYENAEHSPSFGWTPTITITLPAWIIGMQLESYNIECGSLRHVLSELLPSNLENHPFQ